MHVPAKDDGAEAKAGGGDGEEFFLGDELAAEDSVDVETGEFDFGVVLEQGLEGGGGDGFSDGHVEGRRQRAKEARFWCFA